MPEPLINAEQQPDPQNDHGYYYLFKIENVLAHLIFLTTLFLLYKETEAKRGQVDC